MLSLNTLIKNKVGANHKIIDYLNKTAVLNAEFYIMPSPTHLNYREIKY